MIHDRHPEDAHIIDCIGESFFRQIWRQPSTPKAAVTGVHGFPPDWRALTNGLRPPPRELEEHEPGPRAKVRASGISACGS